MQEGLPRNKCSTSNSVPRLIDNKCKHQECQLSAAERDKLLTNEAKEEAMFQKEMIEAIKESNFTFMRATETFGTFMTAVEDNEEFLADNLSDLSDPLLTSTVKIEKRKRDFHETSAVLVTLYPD